VKALTTGQRLRQARAVIRQARTLFREAASLGGGLTEGTRSELRALSLMAEELAANVGPVLVRCDRDLDAVRAAKRRRAA
jgi:hypothetical protein